jgi:hypothetical protein
LDFDRTFGVLVGSPENYWQIGLG